MNEIVPVSCICLTYGRPNLLEEAIHSFLLQDYTGEKELIVLNDYSRQTLLFKHPEVCVFNIPRRFRTIGEKRNAAVALSTHDLLFMWDDDDVCLPHRLSLSVEMFQPSKGYFTPQQAWLWDNGKMSGPTRNALHGAACLSRDLFDSVGGYAAMNSGEDQDIEARFREKVPDATQEDEITAEEVFYIYRWGGIESYHLSGFGCGDANEVVKYVDRQIEQGEIAQGEVALSPGWRADYLQMVAEKIDQDIITDRNR